MLRSNASRSAEVRSSNSTLYFEGAQDMANGTTRLVSLSSARCVGSVDSNKQMTLSA